MSRNPNMTPLYSELSYPQQRAMIDAHGFGSIAFGMRGSHEPGKEPRAASSTIKRLQGWGLMEPISRHRYTLTQRGESMVKSEVVR